MTNTFDVLIIGGGVSGMSCALILGSAENKSFAAKRKIGIFTHQKSSMLQEAIFNNAYGISPGKLGTELLAETKAQLSQLYPHIIQIPDEKVFKIEGEFPEFTIISNKNTYSTKNIIIGIGSANTFDIEGLMEYVEPHQKALPEKQRIQLRNTDHKITNGIYVIGTLAGCRSQLTIAAGSGAIVATDLLSIWNEGLPTQIHDSIKKI
jgi:thioredoxin reductase